MGHMNTTTDLANLTADELAGLYTKAYGQALAAPVGLARTRATNRAARISEHLFNRGFGLQRLSDGTFTFRRI